MSQRQDEDLNRLAKLITRTGGISEDAAENVASAPYLYARVHARIESEREARAGQVSGWLATLLVASRAIAVLLVVTIAAAAAFLISRPTGKVRAPSANLVEDNLDRVIAGGTCALSATDECAISTDEVLATLFSEEGGKSRK